MKYLFELYYKMLTLVSQKYNIINNNNVRIFKNKSRVKA